MGVYDTLIDGERQAQVKCFDCELNVYKVGDQVPCDGSFIIILPPREGVHYAIIKDSIFLGFTDCPPVIIDKWGKHLVSYDAFRDHPKDVVERIRRIEEKDAKRRLDQVTAKKVKT